MGMNTAGKTGTADSQSKFQGCRSQRLGGSSAVENIHGAFTTKVRGAAAHCGFLYSTSRGVFAGYVRRKRSVWKNLCEF